ncbi:C2 domain-containing protein [Linnemannia elongata]|nr:C2 domain-containing protein [Linnemannia elongata]
MNGVQQENGQAPPHEQVQQKDASLADTNGNNNPAPSPMIAGKDRLDETVGKAVGGTVIPSDIHPGDMPTTTQLDADKKNAPLETQPQSRVKPETTEVNKTGEDNEDEDQKDDPHAEDTEEQNQKRKEMSDPKKRTVGAYPEVTRIGWIEAYKRTDGPQNEFRDKSIWMEEFASSALFGSFWHNAAAIITIPMVCFVVFKLGGGFVSLILIIAFGATYYKNSIRRFRRNARDDITRELIRNALENDSESTEWINNFMSKFWLIYEPVLSSTVIGVVDGILVDQTPAFLDSIRLTTFTLGTKAPRVESIKSFPKSDPDVVLMDWRVSFTPTDIEDMTPRQLRTQINPKIVLTIRLGNSLIGAGMPILVEDMSFKGYMRFKLKLTSNFPHIKTVDFCFLEPPVIDYVLKPVGGDTFGMDIAHIPGLQSFIRDQTHAILGPMMYAPNVYTLDLEQMMTGGASLTAAAGVVQFTIYNAKDLKNSEFVGHSDPYIKIRLGNRPEIASTQVQKNTLNPVFNETNIILVNNLNEMLCMEVFDKDAVRKDSPLGQANFDLKSLEEDPIQDDVWCNILLNGKERGSVRIRAAYFPVAKPTPVEEGGEPVPVESNSGILAINIAQAKDIARTGKLKSHCRVMLNGRVVHTTGNSIGANPSWGANVDVFVTDLEAAQITVEIVSEEQVIGSYGAAATHILRDTEEKVDWLSLKGGQGGEKLKMTAVWKPILMGDSMNPTVHKPAFGVARIQLYAARGLKNVEIGSDSDPYVLISGDKRSSRSRTKTIENTLNPEWNEIHYIAINSVKQIIDFEAFDYQKRTKDRTLGKTSFKVNDIVEELPDKAGYQALPAVDRWAPLRQKDGSTKGELHYQVSFHPSLKVAKEATAAEKEKKALAAQDPLEAAKKEVVEYDAEVEAREKLEAEQKKEIPALEHDSGILVVNLVGANLNRSGTYCEVYIDSDYYQHKTQIQKTRDPKWNEIADIFVKELEYAKLTILIKEKSSIDRDPVIGSVTGNIRTLLETTPAEGAEFDVVEKTEKRGTMRLKFEYLPVPIELFPKERLDNMGQLTVHLVGAKNLMAADRSGTSDPYFIFRVNGKEVYKSETVKKNLNPVYDETFVVPIASRADDQFSFEVLDWNQLATAKSLGQGAIDLRNLQLVLPNEFKVPLQNKANQGEVQLRLKFMPEFLSTNKRKSGFGATFLGEGVGMVGQAGIAGVGVVGQAGQGAIKGVGAVSQGAAKGVGAVGKGVFGGLSAGASAIGLGHKRKDSIPTSATAPAVTATAPGSGTVGRLNIQVIEADHLMGVDKSGLSDPYVKVRVNSKEVLKTRVKKETLSPNWSESVVVPGVRTDQPVILDFQVKDHNTIGGNKDLGGCDVSLWEYIQPGSPIGGSQADFWAPVDGQGGKLHLLLEFEPSEA